MQIYQELLSLKFTEILKFESWHPEVRLFVVHDAKEGHRMGHFYLDLHPRPGKYGHAAIFHLLKRWKDQTPVDCMLCSESPQSSQHSVLSHAALLLDLDSALYSWSACRCFKYDTACSQ
jgi:thimet oligopeptidase